MKKKTNKWGKSWFWIAEGDLTLPKCFKCFEVFLETESGCTDNYIQQTDSQKKSLTKFFIRLGWFLGSLMDLKLRYWECYLYQRKNCVVEIFYLSCYLRFYSTWKMDKLLKYLMGYQNQLHRLTGVQGMEQYWLFVQCLSTILT